MGIRGSSTYELIFTDCRIPKENLLGKQGKGFNIAMHTLDGGRIGIAAQALGLAEGALETTIAYVKERKQFGRSIAQFQNTQFQLADMATKVKAAQLMVYRAALKKDEYQAGAKSFLFCRSCYGKTLRSRSCNGSYNKMRTVTWWLWLHQRVRC